LKRSAVLGDLGHIHVHRLDGILRVNHLSDVVRVVEERDDSLPISPPRLADGQIGTVPFVLELAQPLLGLIGAGRLVNALQIGIHLGAYFPGHIVQAVVHHLHNAQLSGSVMRKDRLDCLGEPHQAVNWGNEDVLHALVLQLCH